MLEASISNETYDLGQSKVKNTDSLNIDNSELESNDILLILC